MKDFANIDFTTGAFPSVTADQSSGPTVRDGCPLDADWVNDLFGAFQALVSKAGITPSGNNESSTSSDILDAIRKISGSPGEITFWGGRSEDPIVHENRLMVLGGQVIAINSYPELAAAVYCGDANNFTASAFYKTNDAGGLTRTVLGTYLVLPNCAGGFVRALAGSYSSADPNRTSLGTDDEPGSEQAFQAGSHEHNVGWNDGGVAKELDATSYWLYNSDPGGGAVEDDFLSRGSQTLSSTVAGDAKTYLGGYTLASPDNESRPNNTAFYLMIRY